MYGRTGAAVRRNVMFLVYKCPKDSLCTENGEVFFEKGKGYSNPYRHLKSCVAGGDEQHLLDLYNAAVQETMATGTLQNARSSVFSKLNEREKAMYGYMRLIVLKNLPISFVADTEIRNFSKYGSVFCHRTFKEVLFKLVEIVECKIKDEMMKQKGAVMYDGWTNNSTHYVGIFGVYMRNVAVHKNGVMHTEKELACPLLAASPMANPSETGDDNCDVEDETTSFSARVHIRFFEDVFHLFGVNVHEWVLCQLADNCSVNKRIADLLEIPHVGCNNHKLNLEVRRMIDANSRIQGTIESIHKTMKSCKSGLKNRALLRNITDLCPVLNNQTRWSSIYQMLTRYNRIRDALIRVADSSESSLNMNRSSVFKSKALIYAKQFSEINVVTVELQKQGLSLSDARYILDDLNDAIRSGRDDISSPLYQCSLGTAYTSPSAPIVHSPHFESGVIKIQRQRISEMTEDEKEACKMLRSVSSEISPSQFDNETNVQLSMAQRIALGKRKRMEKTESYLNCDFILGSVAEIERLWSVARNILTDNRKDLTPLVFESVLFLNINRAFWNEITVKEAMAKMQSERSQSRLQEDTMHEELVEST